MIQEEASPLPVPRAVHFYRVYVAIVGILYFAILAGGVWLLLNQELLSDRENVDADKAVVAAWTCSGIGLVFGALFLAGTFIRQQPGHWLIGALLIAMSLGLCVTSLIGFPLFYFWLQPEVRHWFGRD